MIISIIIIITLIIIISSSSNNSGIIFKNTHKKSNIVSEVPTSMMPYSLTTSGDMIGHSVCSGLLSGSWPCLSQ